CVFFFWWCLLEFFFFFQAEDGIRDATVTGVQTCALPISWLAKGKFCEGVQPLAADGCFKAASREGPRRTQCGYRIHFGFLNSFDQFFRGSESLGRRPPAGDQRHGLPRTQENRIREPRVRG